MIVYYCWACICFSTKSISISSVWLKTFTTRVAVHLCSVFDLSAREIACLAYSQTLDHMQVRMVLSRASVCLSVYCPALAFACPPSRRAPNSCSILKRTWHTNMAEALNDLGQFYPSRHNREYDSLTTACEGATVRVTVRAVCEDWL